MPESYLQNNYFFVVVIDLIAMLFSNNHNKNILESVNRDTVSK